MTSDIINKAFDRKNETKEVDLQYMNDFHESSSTNQLCSKDEPVVNQNIVILSESLNQNSIKTIDKKQWIKALKGICFTMISALFFSITTVIVKYVKDVDPEEMAFCRFVGILLFTIPLVMESNVNPFGPSNCRHWLILRGIAGATSLYFRYSALQYLPIANATVIVMSVPVFVFIFARIFLKESFGVFHVIALFITLLGIALTSKVALILNGVNGRKELIGLAFSLGTTLVGSSVYVLMRKIKSLHHSVILLNFSFVAITETAIITLFVNHFQLPTNITALSVNGWYLCLLAVLSFYGQLLLTKALQAEEAGLVSLIRSSSEVIYAFVFQIVIFNELPDKWSILGTVLVMTSVLMTSTRKWILTLPTESKIRISFNFITK